MNLECHDPNRSDRDGRKADCKARRKAGSRASFTLIELLVVVGVILILFSISIKVIGLANRKAGVAKTIYVIEQVKNALAAFHAEYGCYPPVSTISYTWLRDPSITAMYPSVSDWNVRTGLVFYLKYYGNCARWAHYVDPVLSGVSANPSNVEVTVTGVTPPYTNLTRSIYDAWGKEIRYAPGADNQSYSLWSCGPNYTDDAGTNDDIGVFINE